MSGGSKSNERTYFHKIRTNRKIAALEFFNTFNL